MLWRSLRYECLFMFKQWIWSNKFVLIFPIKISRNATPKETLLPSVPTCLDYCYFMSRHSVWLESPDYCHCCRCHCRCLSMALSLSQFLNIVNNSTSELKLEHIENMSMLHGTAVLQRELTRRDVSFVIVGVSKCLCLAFQSVVVGWCLPADVFSSCQLTDIIFFTDGDTFVADFENILEFTCFFHFVCFDETRELTWQALKSSAKYTRQPLFRPICTAWTDIIGNK